MAGSSGVIDKMVPTTMARVAGTIMAHNHHGSPVFTPDGAAFSVMSANLMIVLKRNLSARSGRAWLVVRSNSRPYLRKVQPLTKTTEFKRMKPVSDDLRGGGVYFFALPPAQQVLEGASGSQARVSFAPKRSTSR